MKNRFSSLLACATAAIALAGAALMTGCVTTAGVPTVTEVQAIQNACAIDAGLRPTVTVLLAVPDLATPAEVAAVAAARAVIDPVCANPGGNVQGNTLAVLTSAAGQIAGILTDLQARKAAVGAGSELTVQK